MSVFDNDRKQRIREQLERYEDELELNLEKTKIRERFWRKHRGEMIRC